MSKGFRWPRRAALASLVVLGSGVGAWLAVDFGTGSDREGGAEAAARARNDGLAWLEAGRPEEAEPIFRELATALPGDPLGDANLAVALLRQRDLEAARVAADRAVARAPARADLYAIRTEILAARGDLEPAAADVRAILELGSDDPRVLFVAYRLLQEELAGEAEASDAAERVLALRKLRDLRPDNPYLVVEGLRAALEAGDRTLATGEALRLRELLGAEADAAGRELAATLAALEASELNAARVGAARLRNLLLPGMELRQGLAELQGEFPGVPVTALAVEPPRAGFGDPIAIGWRARPLREAAVAGFAVADFDGDGRADWVATGADRDVGLELSLSGSREGERRTVGATGPGLVRAADLDNDGRTDLAVGGASGIEMFFQNSDGDFERRLDENRPVTPPSQELVVADLDLEGDLDLLLIPASGEAAWLRGDGEGSFTLVPSGLPNLEPLAGSLEILAGDLDRDGDADLVAAGARPAWFENRLSGGFVLHPLPPVPGGEARAAILADLEGDGWPDLWVATDESLDRLQNARGDLARGAWKTGLAHRGIQALAAFDGDNDGRLDLAAATAREILWIGQRASGELFADAVPGSPAGTTRLAPADHDADGDLDLLLAGPFGVALLENDGGDRNRWLDVELRALTSGNGKNNSHGIGARLELSAGSRTQWREVAGESTRFGLGTERRADVLRVVWPNGVVQDRIGVASNLTVVEEQVLKGSCPFLYVWDGESIRFVTDLLWGAPLGLPVAPGVWAGSDPTEIVRADGLVPRDGVYDLRLTEELWEAALFDSVRLWVVDHPEDVEVASNLRVIPGRVLPEQVRASRNLEPVVRARDREGRDVTDRVRHRDELYAGSFELEEYQGVATPWDLSFELPSSPRGASRLHLDGWIFPSDASINIAAAQRSELAYLAPRIEVQAGDGWEVLVPDLGLPPGKTKTMVVELPSLPRGAKRLRIVSTHWLAWDRIAWTEAPADSAAQVVERLAPQVAELRYRGFSRSERVAPNAPHRFRYDRLLARPPWQPFPGRYTKYGDVVELLAENDDRFVILAAGDEIALSFDATRLPPPASGFRRTLFLESTGWDKDADRHTFEAARLEPLPFHGMSGYPFREGEAAPDTPELARYRAEWLTREIRGAQSD